MISQVCYTAVEARTSWWVFTFNCNEWNRTAFEQGRELDKTGILRRDCVVAETGLEEVKSRGGRSCVTRGSRRGKMSVRQKILIV